MIKYLIYCRKSSEDEDRQILSIDAQISELKAIASREGLSVTDTLTECQSAKEPGRAVFNDMIHRIERGEANGILAWKLDRLARNFDDGGNCNGMSHLTDYLAAIKKELTSGHATENTYRPALKNLLEASGKNITATNEPKHIPLIGAPDFKISRGKVPLGHIETKDIDTNLAEMEKGKGQNGEQFSRYRSLPNWILTDYLEFRWYVHGERRRTVRVAELAGKKKIKLLPDTEQQLWGKVLSQSNDWRPRCGSERTTKRPYKCATMPSNRRFMRKPPTSTTPRLSNAT
jgi:hypothetical protein